MLKAVAASSGGGAASGITIGTSVITGGTDKRLFYDNNGVVGETAQWTYNNSTGLLLGNMNAAAAPAVISGTGLQIVGADATVGRVASYSFGAIAAFTVARANGTGATPTAIVSGDQLGGFNSYGYRTSGGAAYSGPSSSVQSFATENWTSTANGTKIVLATTPNTTTTLTTGLTIDQDQSVAMAGRATIATSLAIGGATIGSNALAVTGTSAFSGTITAPEWDIASGPRMYNSGTTFIIDNGVSGNSWNFVQGTGKVFLAIDAANTLAQRNGTSAQLFQVYNTYTDASNHEETFLGYSGNVAFLRTSAAGTGVGTREFRIGTGGAGLLSFQTNSTTRWQVDASGHFIASTDNTYDIGASGATRPRTGYFGTSLLVQGTGDAASSTGGALQVAGGASVAKRFWIPAITASAGLQTAVLCQSSGGEMIADSVACLASSARFKTLLGESEDGALNKIIRVPIHRWKYKRDPKSVFPDNYYSEHIGPTAEDIEAIDSRLVGRDQEGRARSISTDQLLALAIQAIQEQQVQIEELKKRA